MSTLKINRLRRARTQESCAATEFRTEESKIAAYSGRYKML